MTPSGMQSVVDTLLLVEQAEKRVGEFYRACAEAWPQDVEFWLGLAEEEDRHAGCIPRMLEILSARPQLFQPGRPFNAAVLKTFISGVEGNIAELRRGSGQEARALYIAQDIEGALIEQKFAEIVRTDDADFRASVNAIVADTLAHKGRLAARIGRMGLKGRP